MSPIVEPHDPDDRRHRLRVEMSKKAHLIRERAARTDEHGRISAEDAREALRAAGFEQTPPTAEPQDAEPPPPGDGGARTHGQKLPPVSGAYPAALKSEIARAEKAGDADEAWALKGQLTRALRDHQ